MKHLMRIGGILVTLLIIATWMMFPFGNPLNALAADANLSWNANGESNLAGYKVYYGTASRGYGAPINVGNRTNYTMRGLGSGTYYFAVTAYNTSGNESGFSNEVSTTITVPDSPILVTFDNPAPPGSSDSLLEGIFQGIDFGSGRWRWTGPFNVDPTNSIYFDSAVGTSRTFTFSPAPKILNSLKVYSLTTGTLTLSDNLGQSKTQTVTTGSMQLVTTGWGQGSTTVTVGFTNGWELGVDDINYSNVSADNPPDTTPPVISGVSSSSIRARTAIINWTTNKASDTQVDYGTTTAYGSSTPLLAPLVTNHTAQLTGLQPATIYHFRVKSRDAAGNLAVSGDYTVKTLLRRPSNISAK